MTQKLGDAFLGQQKDVLAAVQRLRSKAQAPEPEERPRSRRSPPRRKLARRSSDRAHAAPNSLRADLQPGHGVRAVALSGLSALLLLSPGYAAGAALFTFTAGVVIGSALWVLQLGAGMSTSTSTSTTASTGPISRIQTGATTPSTARASSTATRPASNATARGNARASRAANISRTCRAGTACIARGGADQFKGAGGANRGDRAGAGGAGDRQSAGGASRATGPLPRAVVARANEAVAEIGSTPAAAQARFRAPVAVHRRVISAAVARRAMLRRSGTVAGAQAEVGAVAPGGGGGGRR